MSNTPPMRPLVERVRAELAGMAGGSPAGGTSARHRNRLARVAAVVVGHVVHDDLLTAAQRDPDPRSYRRRLVRVETGGGSEEEVIYRWHGPRPVTAGSAVNRTGSTCFFLPSGDVRRVHNAGDDIAVPLHVHGADARGPGSSIRRRYELDGLVA